MVNRGWRAGSGGGWTVRKRTHARRAHGKGPCQTLRRCSNLARPVQRRPRGGEAAGNDAPRWTAYSLLACSLFEQLWATPGKPAATLLRGSTAGAAIHRRWRTQQPICQTRRNAVELLRRIRMGDPTAKSNLLTYVAAREAAWSSPRVRRVHLAETLTRPELRAQLSAPHSKARLAYPQPLRTDRRSPGPHGHEVV